MQYGVSCNAIRDVWNHNTWVAETMPYWTPEERDGWIRLQLEPGKEEKKRKRVTGASRSSSESQVAQPVQHQMKVGRTKAVEHLRQTTHFPPPHDLRDESSQDSMDFRNTPWDRSSAANIIVPPSGLRAISTPSHRSSQQVVERPPVPCSSSSRMGSHFQSLLAPAGADAKNWFEFNCTYSTSSTSAGYTASGGTSLSSGVLQGGSVGDSASSSTGPNNELNLVSSSVRLSPEEETETHGFEDFFGYQL